MPQSGLWLRVFVALVIAVLPPLILLVGAMVLAESVLADSDPGWTAVAVVAGAIAWAAIVAILYARSLGGEFDDLLTLARRGDPGAGGDPGAAYQRMSSTLDERNRQVATLAQQAGLVPIDDDPVRVIRSLVTAVGSVMQDPTWRCAVLASDEDALVPPGIYHAIDDERRTEIGELERWASTAAADAPARHVEGPWGAFVVVDVAVAGQTSAILYAPWQGRAAPSRSEMDLLTLVGQQAGTAFQHSLLYARVRSQADELDRMATIQADFLRGVTHDLQTPLTSIGALATELRADAAVPGSARADLDTIAHQADRLRRMVSQLLVASRIEAGVFTAQTEVFAVQPIVERTWSALRADRPFELEVSGSPHLAVADPDRLEQVLWAVMENAVKYSPAGSPIHVSIDSGAGGVTLTVRDRGVGMDAETRERAFDQFYRSAGARRMAPDGSGVGLYAARGLMQAMGGTIQVEGELGSGTSVTIRVPAEPSAAE